MFVVVGVASDSLRGSRGGGEDSGTEGQRFAVSGRDGRTRCKQDLLPSSWHKMQELGQK